MKKLIRSIQILENAILNVKPLVEVKARRVGGSAYQVPVEVNSERGTVLAIQWILLQHEIAQE